MAGSRFRQNHYRDGCGRNGGCGREEFWVTIRTTGCPIDSMTERSKKRMHPRDVNQLAKSIVDEARSGGCSEKRSSIQADSPPDAGLSGKV